MFINSGEHSITGLFGAVYDAEPWARMRPAQLLYLALLFKLFGSHPLGYHLANSLVFNLMIVLLYKIVADVSGFRLLALSVAAVYALLPHYSTDRFWMAAFQANLSMALYFLSLYSDLQALRKGRGPSWRWRVFSIFCMFGSVLAYEVTLPLFLLNLLVFWRRALEAKAAAGGSRMRLPVVRGQMAATLSALFLVTAFKGLMTDRSGLKDGLISHTVTTIRRLFDVTYQYYNGVQGLNIKRAFAINYFSLGVGLPRVIWRVLNNFSDLKSILVSVALGLIVFAYLYFTFDQKRHQFPGRAIWSRVIFFGLIVFLLGYAIFLTTSDVVLTTTEIDNRTNIAAAVGVAMTFAGALGWVSTLFPSHRFRRLIFCGGVMALCAGGCLIIQSLAGFWAAAYREERQILSEIKGQLPTLPPGSTLLLDGVCCCKGPAVVFRRSWDISGALKTMYKDLNHQGDVVTPRLVIGEQEITIPTEGETLSYRYGQDLLIFNYRHKVVRRLSDEVQARAYFQTFNPGYSELP